jgi:superfamily II DNA or RNA helicase
VDAIKNDGLRGPILWLAPTGELCEQAVQTWAYVWRSKGSSERLSIGRLWEGNQVEESDDSGVQVIVATDAKLHYIIPNPGYTWLANASVVIVDEAHGSTETGYTSILTWLGLGRSQARDRCPLIGLTATPFKGISEEATKRLANRYGARRLDDGVLGDDPYRQLQEMGVLARANQRVLEGANVALSQEQAEEARRLNTLPRHVEEAIASDTNRNRQILSAVRDLDSDWTAILFAASVSHAEQMAALLNFEGIPSAVISAQTDQPARRHYIREFNRGAIRVLCNYGVLTEGFDAPSVRAVIVGRPTFSPNAYQQMVGRGLRGPLNGGKAECLVINVADNILQFGGQLAFHHFDYLFDGQ